MLTQYRNNKPCRNIMKKRKKIIKIGMQKNCKYRFVIQNLALARADLFTF